MRCHARCRNCRTRRVLRKGRPETYLVLPKCRHCGARNYVADKWMMERNTKAMACHADCYPFTHRRGSLRCNYDQDGRYRHGEVAPDLPGIDLPF